MNIYTHIDVVANKGTNDHVFFYKILVVNIRPFVYIVIGVLFWVIVKAIRKNKMTQTQFRDNLLVTVCLIAYILQPTIVKTTLQLFK